MQLILFPHQLYHHTLLPKGVKQINLIEHPYFFQHPRSQIKYHKQKLILHRATMKTYAAQLTKLGYKVNYIEFSDAIQGLKHIITEHQIRAVIYFDPTDNYLSQELTTCISELNLSYERLPSPNFITSLAEIEKLFHKRSTFSQTSFYIWQRKKLKILLDKNGKPVGGKWSYDSENRHKLSGDEEIPHIVEFNNKAAIKSAQDYINRLFPDNPGSDKNFIYPISHTQAQDWLQDFLAHRLSNFGKYQDAIDTKGNFLFHSLLSPLMNIGLLQPQDVINQALTYAQIHRTPLPAVEGFIRQLIGWREYIRAMYLIHGPKLQQQNYWQMHRRLPAGIWQNDVNLTPVNYALQRVFKSGYTHHIERLMVLGNWMMLCEIDPQAAYDWFMSMFVDAYDWVMVPNLWGMSLQTDGGKMVTKPYVSGSNYIRKMSNYPSGPWAVIWDGLFWRFIHKHQQHFSQNARLGLISKQLDSMPPSRLEAHITVAEDYLASLSASA